MNIPRLSLIQALIDKNKYPSYLEIGVSIGTVFFRVKCQKKFAVDPEFGFSRFKVLTRTIRLNNFTNLTARYFEKTSDAFFDENARTTLSTPLGISLVDGMHEFSFALNDVQNTLNYLADDGVIIIHDCNPASESNACSYKEWEKRGFTGEWNGDVWKAIVYLRSLRNDIDVFVADIDQGLGIVTKKRKPGMPGLSFKSFEEIERLTFQEFSKNRTEWLNLKPAKYLNEYFQLGLTFDQQ